ncbi:MFS general substrate transporter [Backusella circina FSU 941]|nr:MFS general substrate transporter [Backusella circina FSU 941]
MKISQIEPESLPKVEKDGGYGWLVVLGAFCVQVTTFGMCNSWGIMQNYYEQNYFQNVPNVAVSLSFVATITTICLNATSPLVQVFVSTFGVRVALITGTILIALGLEMAGFSTQIWHLYLTQGVVFGIGASFNYVAIMGVAPQWFTQHRGLALGIISSGSGIGGLVIPFIMNGVNGTLGAGWTYRIMGFVCLACDIVACCFVKEKSSSKPKTKKRLSQIIRFECLKDMNVLLFTIGSDIALLGYAIPYVFIPSYATFLGLSSSQGTSLVAVTAACNFFGRIVTGFLSDIIGKVNTNVLFSFITCLSCFLIWTFAFTYESLMGFSIVFGLFSGSYFALLSPITAHLVGMEKFPSTLSIILFTNTATAFGTNIASAIESSVHAEPFLSYKIFTGAVYFVATIFLLVLKLRINRSPFAKV